MRLEVSLRALLLLAAPAAAGAVAVWSPGSADASRCGAGAYGSQGYAYAGHQSATAARGVRATITTLADPAVREGHVAGWIGVGGPGAGPAGEDLWLQAGIASLPGAAPLLYVEVAPTGRKPLFRAIRSGVRPGERHRLAVVELAGRRDWWRVWVDGRPVTKPIELPGSSKRWKPIATAESWSGGAPACNGFGFRFEGVSVARRPGAAWQRFVPGYRFQDQSLSLRELRAGPPRGPFAFEAVSSA
jgi:hypothetical protein